MMRIIARSSIAVIALAWSWCRAQDTVESGSWSVQLGPMGPAEIAYQG
jgi:hypothetical protein